MLSFSEKVKDTDLIKKSNAEVAKIYNNKSSTQEIVKKEKNCQFVVAPLLQYLWPLCVVSA